MHQKVESGMALYGLNLSNAVQSISTAWRKFNYTIHQYHLRNQLWVDFSKPLEYSIMTMGKLLKNGSYDTRDIKTDAI